MPGTDPSKIAASFSFPTDLKSLLSDFVSCGWHLTVPKWLSPVSTVYKSEELSPALSTEPGSHTVLCLFPALVPVTAEARLGPLHPTASDFLLEGRIYMWFLHFPAFVGD